jgi:hypothetical protein
MAVARRLAIAVAVAQMEAMPAARPAAMRVVPMSAK